MRNVFTRNAEPLCSWCGERIRKGSRRWHEVRPNTSPAKGKPHDRLDMHEACYADGGWAAREQGLGAFRRVEYDHGPTAYGASCRATLLHNRVPWPPQD